MMTDERVYSLAKDRLIYLSNADEKNEKKYLLDFTEINNLSIDRVFKLAYDELIFIRDCNIEKHLFSVVEYVSEEIEELKELAIFKGLQL